MWLSLGAGLITPLGGYTTYTHLIHEVTQGGSASDNLTFVWLLLLVYYTAKGGVMSVATGWRAMSAHAAEPELLQQLEQLQVRILMRMSCFFMASIFMNCNMVQDDVEGSGWGFLWRGT
jgi:hypothetical protein